MQKMNKSEKFWDNLSKKYMNKRENDLFTLINLIWRERMGVEPTKDIVNAPQRV